MATTHTRTRARGGGGGERGDRGGNWRTGGWQTSNIFARVIGGASIVAFRKDAGKSPSLGYQ